jgi:hypothetical protein
VHQYLYNLLSIVVAGAGNCRRLPLHVGDNAAPPSERTANCSIATAALGVSAKLVVDKLLNAG